MTRIISGEAKGRRLSVPPAGTRPTSDRVRESVFSILEHRIDFADQVVVDLFAGSGALGLEALSRGARSAIFVESHRGAAKVISANLAIVGGVGEVTVTDVARFVRQLAAPDNDAFTLVFADPPYDVPVDQVSQLMGEFIASGQVADDAVFVIETRAPRANDQVLQLPDELEVDVTRTYGDTQIHVADLVRSR